MMVYIGIFNFLLRQRLCLHGSSFHQQQGAVSVSGKIFQLKVKYVFDNVLSSPKDVPGAMSSWSAVISLGDQFDRHVVLCTGEEAELQTRSGGRTRHHFCHRSFPVPMSTFAIAIGAWEVRSIETGRPVTRIIGEGYRSEKRIQRISVLPHPHYSP